MILSHSSGGRTFEKVDRVLIQRQKDNLDSFHATKNSFNKAKLGKATAGEKSLRANTKLQKLQSKSTNVSPEDKKKKLPRSFANCRSYAGSKNGNLQKMSSFEAAVAG